MAATPNLQRKLQQTLGPEAAADLGAWMQSMDAYRSDLGELQREMRAGFARIDERYARMEGRMDSMEASFVGRMDAMETRFVGRMDAMEASFVGRMDTMQASFAGRMDTMQASFDGRTDAMQASFNGRTDAMQASFNGRTDAMRGSFDTMMERGLREQTRFFFLAWSVLLAAIIGLYARG